MTEIKTVVCPNCGANTTNTENCEYCGSLLVRFADKGIDITNTTYLDNSAVLPGLIPELKKNLQLQKENPNIVVATDIAKELEDGSSLNFSIGSSTNGTKWPDGAIWNPNPGKYGLIIVFGFDRYIDDGHEEFNKKMDDLLNVFKGLTSFPLFVSHYCKGEDENGRNRYFRHYAIDFGQDVEGAARLISEYWVKVRGLSLNDSFDIFTNVGKYVAEARKDWDEAHGFGGNGCAVFLLPFVGAAAYFGYQLLQTIV